MIDPASEMTTADGRVIRGPFAVARALGGGQLPPSYSVKLFPAVALELCVDGGLETGMYSVSRIDASSAVGVEAGAYTIRWIVDAQGARIGRIAFGADGGATGRRVGSCRWLSTVAFHERRFELAAGPFALGSLATRRRLEDDLANAGWSRSAAFATRTSVPSSGWLDGFKLIRRGGRQDNSKLVMAAGTLRFRPTLLLQASTQLTEQSGALATFNPRTSSRLIQQYTLREVGAAELLVERHSLRFGAGPVLVTSEWRERYDRLVLKNGAYVTDYTTLTDGHWSRSTMGLVAEVVYMVPISSSLHGGLGGRVRAGAPIRLDGVPTHENWSATMADVQIGLRLGVAW